MNTIGDQMKSGNVNAFKSLAILAGILVYIGMLVYSFVHNYSLLVGGVAEDMKMWAILGVVTLEISAAMLPVAVHFWTHAPMQKVFAIGFYIVDLLLICGNVVIDFGIQSGDLLPEWGTIYAFYIAPLVPIVCGIGWSVLFFLDPSSQERAMLESLRASTRQILANKIIEAAKQADVTQQVTNTANSLTAGIVDSTLDDVMRSALPGGYRPLLSDNLTGHNNGNGRVGERKPKQKRWFHNWSRTGNTDNVRHYNSDTEDLANPKN